MKKLTQKFLREKFKKANMRIGRDNLRRVQKKIINDELRVSNTINFLIGLAKGKKRKTVTINEVFELMDKTIIKNLKKKN